MSKKVGVFFVGYMLAILIIYVIPTVIMFPNIIGFKNTNPSQFVTEQDYEAAVNKIQAANLKNELNIFNAATVSSVNNQVNTRNYIIIFYAVMLFICLFVIGLMLMKNNKKIRYFGKGLICGNFVGAAGLTATILFSASYFIK